MTTSPRALGINLVGYLKAESGVGENARTLLATLDAAGIPVAPLSFARTRSRQDHQITTLLPDEAFYDVNLLAVNADQTAEFAAEHGESVLRGRYSIGYWAWEVEEFPEWMAAGARFLDEIWAVSSFAARAIARQVSIPVHAVPCAVDPPRPAALPEDFPSPPGFRVLCAFDFDSVVSRKNPVGAIRAYCDAFGESDGAHLVLKSVNGHLHGSAVADLQEAASGRSDIVVVDRYLSRAEHAALVDSCDVLLSLHRAEGFGFGLAEAMLLGKPVVATGYSGNMDFMSEENSRVVPFQLTAIGEASPPYTGRWAEPETATASRALRDLFEHRELATQLGQKARLAIFEQLTPEKRAKELARLLAEPLRRARGSRAGAAPGPHESRRQEAPALENVPAGPLGRARRRLVPELNPLHRSIASLEERVVDLAADVRQLAVAGALAEEQLEHTKLLLLAQLRRFERRLEGSR